MRLVVFILFLVTLVSAQAQPKYMCVVCEKPIERGTVWIHKRAGKTNYICDVCYKLPDRCSICGLPAAQGLVRLPDGRTVCQRDINNVVRAEDEAQRIFWEARREVERMTEGRMSLRSPHLTIKMFDVPFWNNKVAGTSSDQMHLEGVATSPLSGNEYYHNINLLGGVTRADMGMTSAHEYTHLWINENRPKSHKIDEDTLEAICELVAFKLAIFRQDEAEMERIKTNPYTNGKILSLIDYEKQFGLAAVLEWVKSGTEANLDKFDAAKAKAAAGVPTAASPFLVPAQYVPPAPTSLVLKGLLGNSKKRLALINDRTFEKSEEGKMRVGEKTVLVRCVDILDNAVIIRVDGVEQTLYLDGR